MTARAWIVSGVLGVALAAVPLRSEELTPEQQNKRAMDLLTKLQEANAQIAVLQKRVSEAEKRTVAVQLVAEEYAVRLDAFEKGAAEEFRKRSQPEALNRLLDPVNAANVGDWISYVKTVTGADGKKTESTCKFTVAAKDQKSVKLTLETEQGGKTESADVLYKGYGPLDVFDPEGKQRRKALETTYEKIKVGVPEYTCMKIRYGVGAVEEGKEKPAAERTYWVNPSIPLTGTAKAEGVSPDGEKISYILLGAGSK